MVNSLAVIQSQVEALSQAIRYQAQQHRYTIMAGRTHGIHAEPITFGFKLAGWLAEVLRSPRSPLESDQKYCDRKNFRCSWNLRQCRSRALRR